MFPSSPLPLPATAQSPVSPSYSQASGLDFPPDMIIGHVMHLVQVVQTCLKEHSSMQSTAIKDSAKELMNTYKSKTSNLKQYTLQYIPVYSLVNSLSLRCLPPHLVATPTAIQRALLLLYYYKECNFHAIRSMVSSPLWKQSLINSF